MTKQDELNFLKFGLTNDENELIAANKFREDAISDGWTSRAGYTNEAMESYAHLEKDGFKMHVMARTNKESKYKYSAQVSIWGTDGLCVHAPKVYDHDKIFIDGMKRCNNCGDIGETFQYSFAGRCCNKCLPEMRKKHEYSGWTR
jgi:hypothetical protein